MTEPLTVFQAWNLVMDDVQSISKDSRNAQQKFNFRGIDAVMNAVGPSLRKHGVTIVPRAVGESAERYQTSPKDGSPGTPMINRIVKVEFNVIGPQGDNFSGAAFGEAADSGDKAMAKAHSVAYRTFLLQALTIPTDEPDPDASSHNRAPVQPDNQEGRDVLRQLCTERGWTTEEAQKEVSTVFRKKFGTPAAFGTNENLKAFVALARTGAIDVQVPETNGTP